MQEVRPNFVMQILSDVCLGLRFPAGLRAIRIAEKEYAIERAQVSQVLELKNELAQLTPGLIQAPYLGFHEQRRIAWLLSPIARESLADSVKGDFKKFQEIQRSIILGFIEKLAKDFDDRGDKYFQLALFSNVANSLIGCAGSPNVHSSLTELSQSYFTPQACREIIYDILNRAGCY